MNSDCNHTRQPECCEPPCCSKPSPPTCCTAGPEGPQGPQGIPGEPGPQGPPGTAVSAGGSYASHTAQTFLPPLYGAIAFDQIGYQTQFQLSADGRYAIPDLNGLYLIEYGVRAANGLPGICTISFTPGGIDHAARIALTGGTMVSGSIIRHLGARTRIGLRLETTTNNGTVTLPESTAYSNAYLSISRIGP